MTAQPHERAREPRTCWHCRRVLSVGELDDPAGSLGRRGHLCHDCTDDAVLGATCPSCGSEPAAERCES